MGTNEASALVKSWKPKAVAEHLYKDGFEDTSYVFDFPNKSYVIRVYFIPVKGNNAVMRVRATNWRYEDEPNGVFDIAECRKFARRLISAGFVRVQN